MKRREFLCILVLSIVVLPLFHNCGQFEAKSDSLSSSACSADMWPLFEDTYYQFFKTNNCKTCHAPGGVSGLPQFANPDSKKGVEVFLNFGATAGPDIVENKLRAGHQGYNFSNLQEQLADYKKEWNEQVQSGLCTAQSTTTYSQSIDFFEPHPTAPEFNIVKASMTGWQTLTWDLGKLSADLKGYEITAEIQIQANEFMDPEHYYVRNLQVKNPKSVRVKKVYVLLNKKTYFVTTFSGINNTYVPSATVFQPLNDGGSAGTFVKEPDEKYANSDKWSIQMELFEIIE
jgi:hypothetical protein